MTETENERDVVIVGGGPAGLSAAVWCRDLGLSALLIEKKENLGGQLPSIHNPIENYLGVKADNGALLLDQFMANARDLPFRVCCELLGADLSERSLVSTEGTEFRSRAIIIATGVRRRSLGVPGENKFYGRGVLRSGVGEKLSINRKKVLIVGGGDAAIENALSLSEIADRVIVVHRGGNFSARHDFIAALGMKKNVEVLFKQVLRSIDGDDAVRSVTIEDTSSGESSVIPVDAVLVRIGVIPNSEPFQDQIATDDAGYIKVGTCGETVMRGIYAIGDVANPIAPTISTAVGTAAMAVKHIAHLLKG